MLRTRLIHPEILRTLGAAGHGSQVLISDGNFPNLTAPAPSVPRVYLNLRPGLISATDILETVGLIVPIERAALMDPDDGGIPPAHMALAAKLPRGTPVDHLERAQFYAATRSERLALVIASGDDRWYANILLTVGAIEDKSE